MVHPDLIKNPNYSFDGIVEYFHSVIKKFPDKRIGNNTKYKIEDAALGGFSLFFTQSPSFLVYQNAMQKSKGQNNAQSLFGVCNIPTDNHIRDLLDEVSPTYVFPVFRYIFNTLNQIEYLDSFRSFNENLLIALDGTQYYSSNKIHCEHCNKKRHENGSITYSHSVITPVIVRPGNNKVIALEPEFITPQDGESKEDCENVAAKRWFRQYAQSYKEFGITILGDDLYCKQPMCELILEQKLDFILVCKPESHKTLYEYVDFLHEDIQTVEVKRWQGKRSYIDTYRFINQVPLRDGEDALEVNWCELITTRDDGKLIYKNTLATSFKITKKNVIQIVADGRARWKIENENNNVLKTKGYHLEHNFGHGKNHLSKLLFTFNILAFLFHTFLEFTDKKYRMIRYDLPTRKTFFDDMRALTRYIYFKSWDDLLIFMMKGLELEIPDVE